MYVNKDKEYEVSYFELPEVFGRLWVDAENKNKKLREIEVKRVNRAKDDYDVINPNPTDRGSGHVDLEQLHSFGVKKK